jgi:hypothetical protein
MVPHDASSEPPAHLSRNYRRLRSARNTKRVAAMMAPTLFDVRPVFGGKTYDAERDEKRLTGLLERVYGFLQAHEWVTLHDIHAVVGGSEAGVSARLRDLRKADFGAHDIQRRRRRDGLFEYRLRRELA